METEKNQNRLEDHGAFVFAWEALDALPHRRSKIWYGVFIGIILLVVGVLFFLIENDWGGNFFVSGLFSNLLMLVTFLVAVGVYLQTHKKQQDHVIQVYEKTIFIDRDAFPVEKIKGYWFLQEGPVQIIHLVVKRTKWNQERTIALQMGEESPSFFREGFDALEIPELLDEEESWMDKIIRYLKL